MPITRKLVAQDNEENQILALDSLKRFVVNHCDEWQWLFGPNSGFTNSVQILKLSAEFDTQDLNSVRVVGYLYNTYSGTIDNAASCVFNIYRVDNIMSPKWNDVLVHTVSGTQEPNSYFFADVNLSNITGANLDGDQTLMVEAVITRLGRTYRDRVYVNHLGVYDSILRLRNEVEFLDITKLDE